MIELSDREAGELRERLRRVALAQPAEETIAVSANASTSVTFTHTQKVAVIEVLAQWMNELGGEEFGEGLFKARSAARSSSSACSCRKARSCRVLAEGRLQGSDVAVSF